MVHRLVRNLTDASTVASLHVSNLGLLIRRVKTRNPNAFHSFCEQSTREATVIFSGGRPVDTDLHLSEKSEALLEYCVL